VVASVVAVHLAGTRDLGASALPDHVSAVSHLRLLSGPMGLTIRLIRPAVIGWGVAIAASGLLLGLVAKAAGGTISGSSVKQVFTRLGAPGTGTDTYLGVAFLMLALLVSFGAAGQVTAARAEEADGRLEHIVVRPYSRASWFGTRLLTGAALVGAGGLVAGLFTWLGAAIEHAGVSVTALLGAGLNIAPPAICILGLGALVLGAWPRAASMATYGMLTWSLLLEITGGVGTLNHWVLDTSVFHQMAAAPAVSANWETGGVMVAVGVLSAVTGGLAFTRRDLKGE
jgi:ABC-2 type transport system permease protein